MADRRSNTPSHKRVDISARMRITDRDQAILNSVYHYRLLSSHQIEALHFPSGNPDTRSLRSACQRRLQLMFHHGLLDRVIRPLIPGEGRQAYTYTLARQGADYVAAYLGVDREHIRWSPKDSKAGQLFVDHLLAVNEVRCVAELLVKQGRWLETDWLDELAFKSDFKNKTPARVVQGRKIRIYPDGYFTVRLPDHERIAHFFVEVDRGTMTNKRWADKMKTYVTFRASGDSNQAFATRNFRVLAITTTAKRLANLRAVSEQAGAGKYFWFTTTEHINIWQPDAFLAPIWHIAGREPQLALF